MRTLIGPIEQLLTPIERSGKSNSACVTMLNQCLAYFIRSAVYMLECINWQSAFFQGSTNGCGCHCRSLRMGRMRFNDHRTSSCQGGGCIPSGGRISIGEIAGAKNNDRSQGDHHFSQIGSRRISVGESGIDADAHPITLGTSLAV